MSATHAPRVDAPTCAFDAKRRVVVQLLKDWADSFAVADEPGWSLNREVTYRWGNGDIPRSHRALDLCIKIMGKTSPCYPALQAVFLHDAAGHSDYDCLKSKAREFPYSDSTVLLARVDEGIDELTRMLLGVDLFCTFPDREIKTTRREQAEDRYLELANSFDTHLAVVKKTHRRAIGKAYDLVADEHSVSRNTVERAVKWRNEHENHGQKHRLAKARKNRRKHANRPQEVS